MPSHVQAETAVRTIPFGDRVAAAVQRKRSQLVVGLDPVPELLPVELRGEAVLGRQHAADACARFCRGIVDAVAPYAVGVKPQSAFFEALGSDGVRAFEDVCAYARAAGLLVIADAKRGDIGSSARAYSAAFLEPAAWPPVREGGAAEGVGGSREASPGRPRGAPLADALTVNPYLGRDAVEPFLAACRRDGAGIFCLVRTSNPGGAEVQELQLSDGRRVWQQVAELVRDWGEDLVGESGLSSVGAVVGATYPREVAEARRILPRAVLLLPGIGAQGGQPADVARAFTSGPASALVAASRSVIYAFRGGAPDWRAAAGLEAARLAREIRAVSGW